MIHFLLVSYKMAVTSVNKSKLKKDSKKKKNPKTKKEPKKETNKEQKYFDEFDLQDIALSDVRIILHLPLSVLDTEHQIINHIQNEQIPSEPNTIPQPFGEDNNYSLVQDTILLNPSTIQHDFNQLQENVLNTENRLKELNKKRKEELNEKHITDDKHTPLFIDFIDAYKHNTWPQKTNIDCLWCCHSFTNKPVGIPIKKENDKYFMFGCFCNSHCAAAYNFDSKYSSNEIWERYSMLNMIYGSMNEPIKIAPPRLSLKKFGGKFSIEEFRESCKDKYNDYELIMPPLRSIIPTLEEVTMDVNENYDNYNDNKELLQQKSQQLRLQRSKPLPNFQNTLETCMNLRYLNST